MCIHQKQMPRLAIEQRTSSATHWSICNPHTIPDPWLWQFNSTLLIGQFTKRLPAGSGLVVAKTRLWANAIPCIERNMVRFRTQGFKALQDQLWCSPTNSESTACGCGVFNGTITVMSSFYIESGGRTLVHHQIRTARLLLDDCGLPPSARVYLCAGHHGMG